AVGGVVFALLIVPRDHIAPNDAMRARCATLIVVGAVALGICQLAMLALKLAVLASYLGSEAYGRFPSTLACRAGLARAGLAFVRAGVAAGWRRAPAEPRRRNAMCVMAVLTAASGAWLVHAAGRLENRGTLMAFTVLHQAAAAMWAGGLLHLGAMWRLGRRD